MYISRFVRSPDRDLQRLTREITPFARNKM